MNSITIEGAERAMSAGEWCNKHIGSKWEIGMQPFATVPKYVFKFKNSIDASFFALRWR